MNTLNDKLRRFEAAILKTAEQKRDQIVKETNELKQNELNSTEDTALTTAYEMIQGEVSEISAEQAREISKIRFDQKRRYLVRRGELEAELFAAVKKGFAITPKQKATSRISKPLPQSLLMNLRAELPLKLQSVTPLLPILLSKASASPAP